MQQLDECTFEHPNIRKMGKIFKKVSLVTGKSEKYYCQLTMCRCTTVMEFKNIAMDRVKSEIMKENKNYTSGIIGERVNKLTGDLDEYKRLALIEGRLFLQVVQSEMNDFSTQFDSIHFNDEILLKMNSFLKDDSKQYQTLTREEASHNFVTSDLTLTRHQINVIQYGIDNTTLFHGLAKYSSIQK